MEMKAFWAFVRKEFYHIFRDPRTMLILLGMPVIEIILFGFAISNEVKNVRIAVMTPHPTELIRKISDRIDANQNLKVRYLFTQPHLSESLLRRNEIDMALVFDDEFEANLMNGRGASVQIIANATDANTSEIAVSYIRQIFNEISSDIDNNINNVIGVMPTLKLLYNPGMKSAYNFVPGVMGMILMLICAMMTSLSIVREKEHGTMEMLLVSPVRPILVITAKGVPYFILSCLNLVSILLLSVFALEVPIHGNLYLLILVSLLFILVSLALGLLISTFVKTQVAGMMISGAVLMMPIIVFSGMIFPIENMPPALQYFSHLIPAKWYISAVRRIMIEGLGIAYVGKEILILSIMAVILLYVSIRKFKNRLE